MIYCKFEHPLNYFFYNYVIPFGIFIYTNEEQPLKAEKYKSEESGLTPVKFLTLSGIIICFMFSLFEKRYI